MAKYLDIARAVSPYTPVYIYMNLYLYIERCTVNISPSAYSFLYFTFFSLSLFIFIFFLCPIAMPNVRYTRATIKLIHIGNNDAMKGNRESEQGKKNETEICGACMKTMNT